MRAVPIALWITLGGTAVQVGSLFTHFYVHDGARRTAWFGIPMTSELILASALITVALVGLTAAGRSPVSGRSAGAYIGIMATLAVLQVSYRMVAPPFGGQVSGYAGIIGTSCLYYCLPSRALPADLLPGIWAALAGCVLVATGGWLHALWPGHRHAPEYKWGAALQFGITPWLGLAALGAIGQFVFGYTFFTFYTTQLAGAVMRWSGWLPTPHVAALVLWVTVLVLALVWNAARERAPFTPSHLGMVIAVLGAVSAGRIAYRIFYPPFLEATEIGPAAYIALISALLIVAAGLVQAVLSGRRRSPHIAGW